MDLDRRTLLQSAAAGSTVVIAGCLGGDDSSSDGSCGTVSEHLHDSFETVSAGSSITHRFDLQDGDLFTVAARRSGDGARPSIRVEGPDGSELLDIGPQADIEHQLTADSDGRYYVEFYNSAVLNSGTWDMDVYWEGCPR